MRSLVIYDSNFGNTKTIAEAIARELHGSAIHVNEASVSSLKDIDVLIVGSPINAWRPTAKIKSFLKSLPANALSHVKAAAFDTRIKIMISGNAAKKISKAMERRKAEIVLPPRGFYVKDSEGPLLAGEVENAQQWAKQITQK